MESHYKKEDVTLYLQDAFEVLKELPDKSVDMIYLDPPYFLSGSGIGCKNGKQVPVFKGDWDKPLTLEEKHAFNKKVVKESQRVLKDNGTVWISGTMHNIYSVGMALEEEKFRIMNNVTWRKLNPPPNLACRCYTHSTETVLWAKKPKGKHYFNYELMKQINDNKQMKDVWEGTAPKKAEKVYGNHPAQKPEWLLERIVLASTKEGDTILDPFMGSGTSGVIAKRLNRKYIGVEINKEYMNIAEQRIDNTKVSETESEEE